MLLQSSYEEVTLFNNDKIQEYYINESKRIVIQLFIIPDIDMRVIYTSISLRKYELDMIDKRAKLFGYSQSEFFVIAVKTYKYISK